MKTYTFKDKNGDEYYYRAENEEDALEQWERGKEQDEMYKHADCVSYGDIWVSGYANKRTGVWIRGYCRSRKRSEK